MSTDYMSSLYAAGTHNPWASITQYCSRKRGRGRERQTGETERVAELWKRRRGKWESKREQSQNDGGKESRKKRCLEDERLGDCVCETPFKLPAESVQLHVITWEGQQRCSFPMATFYGRIYTDQQRLTILFFLSNTHTHTHVSRFAFPFSP